MPLSKLYAHSFSQTTKIVFLVGLLLLVVGVSGYFVMIKSENTIIENQSVSVAEIVARQASAARSVYTSQILDKIKKDEIGFSDRDYHNKHGALPIPAQFLKNMATKASEDAEGLYKYRAVSKWNLDDHQDLNNDFLKDAWSKLEQQDQANPAKAIDWKPIYRVEEFEGKQTLLYLKADPATQVSCVECHNDYEKTEEILQRRASQNIVGGKVWKQHQLLGAIFVQIPVDKMHAIASKNSKFTILWILSSLIIGLSGLAYFFSRDLVKARGVTKLLFWQAKHDNLTKLPNRISFEERSRELISESRKKNSTHAMCFLDLDQFKLVNDTCGHATGDDLLCQISEELLKELIKPDMLARLGGDEFGILLTNCSLEEAKVTAKRLCENVKNYHFVKDEHAFDIGASIGVVAINKDSQSVDQLMRAADLACYMAKDNGRNRVQIYRENDEVLNLRKVEMKWVSGISRALKENRIIIYSQKIVAIEIGSNYTHHEILVRLIGDDGEIVPPNEFIPAAERYNLMPKLDLAIIDRSFSALSNKYFKDLSNDGFISINLSGQSLSEADFLVKVKQLMMKHRINPAQVCFEITESAAIANQDLVKRFMKEMKSLNVKFALDDFGTGLSSLTYLKEFPVDYLKIDGSFIKDILTDSVDRTLVEAINDMAHTMGLKTVAEYVESKEILNLLSILNIDYAQGYFIQKPTEVTQKF
ncbi:EAL domain-containing protein [Cocleimonas sp. KMM 6892]|uniref:EAL domain-containing protein n=1 Tax=unclassified Cocleimonas TaxID=2639732 RepID=UPI002DB889B0|nr:MULTISPECIES: EAL domain-containing protein [unclassified Cocleimonas]MEB8431127.1 EAL domain-containing protein [Cocleimonas sp. KMM 6892]MEC4714101.1 EAL domain-containing protein [Cocleimonas sp. KMM 6895]MEC4743432.1 EAL domain-containing protein [Cocleimonas sp. KMM 6896]